MKFSFLFALIIVSCASFSQAGFYVDGEIHQIKFYFHEDNWDQILDSFYVAGDEERLLASIEIDGEAYDSVGIRYKGFSSVSVDRKKNPFNIKLDFLKNQDHNGVDKIKLSNVIQDPSFVRESLSYEIARKYMPASGANYVRLYINDEYWGTYTNVESVNKSFLRKHFGSGDNTFVKANPDHLDLNGENCNLNNSPGTDTVNYTSLYEMKSDHGYADLYQLIDVLNTDINQIESILNVDRTLWMHALNYVLINFDSYVGYAQNYYLYQDQNGQFNPILWDLNQSFGSFRLTDASDYFQGFSIDQAKIIDPMSHYNSFSVQARPLIRNLLENERYRKMYLAHIRTIVEENFANGLYKERATSLQNTIDQSVREDENKFYSYTGFHDNLNNTVTDLVEYPGITDLMDGRTAYLQQYAGYDAGPEFDRIEVEEVGTDLRITVEVSNATDLILAYRYDQTSLFTKVEMYDDGAHNDGQNGDGIYGVSVENRDEVYYFLYAENSEAGQFSPARAAYELYSQVKPPDVAINEVCSSNDNIIADPQGEYDDWIELYNNAADEISLKGYFLSDDASELTKWAFPDISIGANGYLIIWADGDIDDDGLHASFKLSGSGESIFLTSDTNEYEDQVSFGAIPTDITYGRAPNGIGAFTLMNPTPNAENEYNTVIPIDLSDDNVTVYPNPAGEYVHILFDEESSNVYDVKMIDLKGQILYTTSSVKPITQFRTEGYSPGLYIIQVSNEHTQFTSKLFIQ